MQYTKGTKRGSKNSQADTTALHSQSAEKKGRRKRRQDTPLDSHSELTDSKTKPVQTDQQEGFIPSEHNEEGQVRGSKTGRLMLLTYFNVCLFATCFSIQIDVVPFLSRLLGVDPVMFGNLQSVLAVIHICASPVFGRFGDLYSARSAMMLALGASALSYGITAVAYTLPLLFLSRLFSIFMYVFQGSQMIIADITDEHGRSDSLAKLGLSYGLGMMFGPKLGRYITSSYGEWAVALIASGGSVFGTILVWMFVPTSIKNGNSERKVNSAVTGLLNIKAIINILATPGVAVLFCIKIMTGISTAVIQETFSVVAVENFRLTPDQNGLLRSYLDITAMVMQGIGVGVLTRRFSDINLLRTFVFLLVVAHCFMSFIATMQELMVVCLLLVVGSCTTNIVISSSLTKTVSSENTGTILGFNIAVHSTLRAVSPWIGGYVLKNIGLESIGYLGLGCNLFAVLVLFRS